MICSISIISAHVAAWIKLCLCKTRLHGISQSDSPRLRMSWLPTCRYTCDICWRYAISEAAGPPVEHREVFSKSNCMFDQTWCGDNERRTVALKRLHHPLSLCQGRPLDDGVAPAHCTRVTIGKVCSTFRNQARTIDNSRKKTQCLRHTWKTLTKP